MIRHTLTNIRKEFKIIDKDVLRWFPGHMDKGIKQIQRKLINIDAIIEVHDARIPISGRNPQFKSNICGHKPHILVLNKKDLTNYGQNSKVYKYINEQYNIDKIIWTNARDNRCKGIKSVLPITIDAIKNSERYHRSHVTEYNIMIIGVPNVGKSSVINLIRSMNTERGCGTAVGGVAGITRSVLERIKICNDPPMFVYDTPGILTPTVPDVYQGLKLALCSCLQDHLVGEETIADFLLYHLNKYNNFKYVDYLGLEKPSDSISVVLVNTAINLNRYIRRSKAEGGLKYYPDIIYAAKHFINAFRTGQLGNLLLDRDLIEENENVNQ